jgi:diguanylate cyclase (GGDEF)-like protein
MLREHAGMTALREAYGLDRRASVEARTILHQSDRSEVYRCQVPNLGRMVICKETRGPTAAARLSHEKRVLERLAGIEGVPALAADAVTDGTLTFEDDGATPLHALLADRRLVPAEVAAIGHGVARILAEIHRVGVLHKDLNPSNILLQGEAMRPVLIDFDLATTFAEERPAFTHHSEIIGTLGYLAPEQTGRTARPVDQRSDLYALGITLYELATGELPFRSHDPLQIIRDHLATVPAAPASIDPTMPMGLSDIVMRLLEKEPDRRYRSAEGLAHDLTLLCAALARGEHGSFTLGEHDFPRQLRTPRLIGRDGEFDTLRRAFEAAAQGDGGGILVAGAPGVGKTALIEELRAIVTARRGWFVYGKVDQFRHDAASGPITQAIRGLGHMLLAESPAEVALERVCILAALGDNAGIATAVAPEFAALLGPQSPMPHASPGQARARGVAFALSLLRTIASPNRPVVIVLDDLQWADPITIELFEKCHGSGIPGLFVIGAYRPAEIGVAHPLAQLIARLDLGRQELGGQDPGRQDLGRQGLDAHALAQSTSGLLRLANLPPADISTLLGEMLRLAQADAARLAGSIGAQTDGNPFDTIELVNGLRRSGALIQGERGWEWDDAAIRWHTDRTDVVAALASRIANLPEPAPSVIAVMACLGGEVELGLLDAASGLDGATVREALVAPLEEGLLIWSSGGTILSAGASKTVRFRHDRVHQAAYNGIEPDRREALHLAIARRLAVQPDYASKAAEQYLPAIACIQQESERRQAVELLRKAAATASAASNYSAAERLLAAAVALSEPMTANADRTLRLGLLSGWHQAMHNIGNQPGTDATYAVLARDCDDPFMLVEPAYLQISSLVNRGRHAESLTLGFGLLARLGMPLQVQGQVQATPAETEQRLNALCTRIDSDLAADASRPDTTDPRILAPVKLMSGMMSPAFLCDPDAFVGLVLQAQSLWAEHGPCAPLVAILSGTTKVMAKLRQDYATGYRVNRHILAVGEARGYEPATSWARYTHARASLHWFDGLDEVLTQARRARRGLLDGGDLQYACFTYYITLTALLECAPTLARLETEVDAALAFGARTGNLHSVASYVTFRQFVRALRGPTTEPGSFSTPDFDEAAHIASLGPNRLGSAYLHIYRALTAALFDDGDALERHAAAAMPLLSSIDGFYPVALAHTLQGLALARRLRRAETSGKATLRTEFDASRTWLARRAADAPGNYLHLVHLLDAELAWADGDYWAAHRAFDDGITLAHRAQRPWHQALLTERAALLHLEQGLSNAGQPLMAAAYGVYEAWGADAKLRQIRERHGASLAIQPRVAVCRDDRPQGSSNGLTSDTIDLLGILRASQALSSETVLDRLYARVNETLSALTGATTVRIVLCDHESGAWYLPPVSGASATDVISLEEAGRLHLLPLSAFHCVQHSGETLIVEDATRDDRFARDEYFAGVECCSLLFVPIRKQGVSQAMLLLENRLSRGAFSAERLDAVSLIAGQLAVSLENALMYASLEEKVAERTRELWEANRQLEVLSNTDALTGLFNRRHFMDALDREWARAQRRPGWIAIVMIDVDHFKKYNDHYGHLAGDACLRQVAAALQSSVRQQVDVAARYGGEEFAVIVPDVDTATAGLVAERIRKAVADLRVPHAQAEFGFVSASIGVATLIPSGDMVAEELIHLADRALYDAKRNGRDQVCQISIGRLGVVDSVVSGLRQEAYAPAPA